MKFTMMTEAYEGGFWFRNFAFDAIDQADADKKAFRWARYHGKDVRTVKAEPSNSDEQGWEAHNDWVK